MAGVRPASPASAKPPVSGEAEHPDGTCVPSTILTCFHPRRWISPGGHLEVCSTCSEIRRPPFDEFWLPAQRIQVREGDELAMYCADGRRLYRRDPVRSAP